MSEFPDHFSGHAKVYATYRPKYPSKLYHYLKELCPDAKQVWDCATGSGQAAEGLAQVFDRIFATDASAEQIAAAVSHPRIEYLQAPAESVPFPAGSMDLVTVAQALHWFRMEAFYAEVKRVLRPGGILAVWCYELANINTPIDRWVDHYYRVTLNGFWPPERKWIEEGYRSIPFPFESLPSPHFEMEEQWSAHEWLGYLRSWSATQKWIQKNGTDPLARLEKEFFELWGDPDTKKKVRWPLQIRLGRLNEKGQSTFGTQK